ncbi:MAG: hypothetical protein CMJ71_01680 [Planctomycetaceae bacterium]|nr:hypothetical protein [Planctomycetaceae bacterium]
MAPTQQTAQNRNGVKSISRPFFFWKLLGRIPIVPIVPNSLRLCHATQKCLLMRLLIHTARLSMIAGIIACLFYTFSSTPNQPAVSLTTIPLNIIQNALPSAVAFGRHSQTIRDAVELQSALGEPVGFCFQTSPISDTVVGFSGPSNLLVICDPINTICGISVLSSADTRDHVSFVEKDTEFWDQFIGRSLAELKNMPHPHYHTTAGATLTSLAMIESVAKRLGKNQRSTRFPAQPTLSDIQKIFPRATSLRFDAGDSSVIHIYDSIETPIGWALRTTPAADSLIGYQGPTDTLIGFDTTGIVAGLCVLQSFDNEPYVGYVREDPGFENHFLGQTFEDLAALDQNMPSTEGVSGATMTSQAIAEAIVVAAHSAQENQGTRFLIQPVARRIKSINAPQWGALLVVLAGLFIGFTRMRGQWIGRIAFPLVVFAYLGFGAGALLSQAQLWGWAVHGIPQAAPVLLFLSIVAILTPATTGRNVYCTQLCAHGAAQQLLKISIPQRRDGLLRRLRKRLAPFLRRLQWLPWALFILCLLITASGQTIPLVDFEPFDAYLPTIAGTAAIFIFVLGLGVSIISPMAYCQHACPTGAFLSFIRLNRKSSVITWQDGILCGCFLLTLRTAWAAGAFTLL